MRTRPDVESVNAFGSPTVVHFTTALVVAALMCSPWSSLRPLSVALAIWGISGFIYSLVVFRRAGHQKSYKPDLEDWIYYVISPSVLYAILSFASLIECLAPRVGLYTLAAALLGLLLVGIRNAWDSVTHLAIAANQSNTPE
jgi:hypothetical protein